MDAQGGFYCKDEYDQTFESCFCMHVFAGTKLARIVLLSQETAAAAVVVKLKTNNTNTTTAYVVGKTDQFRFSDLRKSLKPLLQLLRLPHRRIASFCCCYSAPPSSDTLK